MPERQNEYGEAGSHAKRAGNYVGDQGEGKRQANVVQI
jgi:hypothetical protein